jgi:hypothetical protein
MFSLLEKLFGNRFKIEDSAEDTSFRISWIRTSFIGIIFFFIWAIMVCYGIAALMGLEYMGSMKIIPMDTLRFSFFWIICLIIFLQLFFNSKSVLHYDGYKINYQKRRITLHKYSFPAKDISQIILKEVKNWGEEDLAGPRREIHFIKILLKNGKKINLGSFGEEDTQRIKNKIEKLITEKT